MKKHPFKKVPNAPQPLSFSVSRRVRFEEVDALGIVWHGRYPSYFEDVREALGDHYGIGYLDFFREKVAAPLRQLHFDYLKPLSLREQFTIKAQLHWSEAARLNLTYEIINAQGQLTTSGYSIQMMVDPHRQDVLMVPPPFFKIFLQRWREQEFSPENNHE
jgi:acyl-CoA thioester hydrolase